MRVVVTGGAGFIGSAVSMQLLDRGDEVVGLDNHSDYYDPILKEARLARHADHKNYKHFRADIEDRVAIEELFKEQKFEGVVHLAAQAGVRYSIENPLAYIHTNLVGFGHILEGCRHNDVAHLVYASSSSVYGSNTKMPFSIHDNVDHPLSLYAASKKSNELLIGIEDHLQFIRDNTESAESRRERMRMGGEVAPAGPAGGAEPPKKGGGFMDMLLKPFQNFKKWILTFVSTMGLGLKTAFLF